MKIYSLWHEEAGEEQLLSKEDLERLFVRCDVYTTTHIFIPPHIVNWLSVARAKKMIKISDKICSYIPGIKNNGGTIIFEAKKKN
jgi:hypothetical protein